MGEELSPWPALGEWVQVRYIEDGEMPDIGCQDRQAVQTSSRCDQDISQARIDTSCDSCVFQSSGFSRDCNIDGEYALVKFDK